ncbi:MAG: hypothetical protein PHP23_14235 [Desulfobacterales bacterium]|nr:hypothetical protein [Desulfobacterales bacterium]MDD4073442.1 hypothetical protein [Desulfobacterales bacterium]
MSEKKLDSGVVENLLKSNKIATLDELKEVLNTKSTMTIFRKLKSLEYLSSYSHRGKYYSLKKVAEFDEIGLWTHHSIWFSKFGNLIETVKEFIQSANAGFSARELEQILHVEVKHTLLKLFKEECIQREKFFGNFVYFAVDFQKRKSQLSLRKSFSLDFKNELPYEIEALSDELKVAIILFFSLLDEKQRRLYAGLESFKVGHGGDKKIADLLGIDAHTVAKGRRELFGGQLQQQRIRQKGAGRKSVEKKLRKLSKKLKDC